MVVVVVFHSDPSSGDTERKEIPHSNWIGFSECSERSCHRRAYHALVQLKILGGTRALFDPPQIHAMIFQRPDISQ